MSSPFSFSTRPLFTASLKIWPIASRSRHVQDNKPKYLWPLVAERSAQPTHEYRRPGNRIRARTAARISAQHKNCQQPSRLSARLQISRLTCASRRRCRHATPSRTKGVNYVRAAAGFHAGRCGSDRGHQARRRGRAQAAERGDQDRTRGLGGVAACGQRAVRPSGIDDDERL